jgi:hypothetical protein
MDILLYKTASTSFHRLLTISWFKVQLRQIVFLCKMKKYLKQLDRKRISIHTLEHDPLEETRFWLSKPPVERLIALELLRTRLAGYDNTRPRLQRFFTVTIRSQS